MNKIFPVIFPVIFLALVSCTATEQMFISGTTSQNVTRHAGHQQKSADAEDIYESGLKHEAAGDIVSAMKSFNAAANLGYALAMKKLSKIYDRGNSVVPRNYGAAIQWYHKAKDAGLDFPPPHKY